MKKLLAFLLVFFVTACFSTPNSRFYLLEKSGDNEAISQKRVNIAVFDIVVPEYMDKPQIVLQKPDSPELKVSEFDRWASDINNMVQNVVIADLQTFLPRATVKPLAHGSKAPYIVKINIAKMSGWLGDTAYLLGNWQILNRKGKVLYQENISAQQNIGKSYQDYVSAQSTIWSQTMKQIAGKLAN